ncbi:MAG: BadM/Rrf2 family transcriptional regulator, partial [Thermotoga petrophila]
MALRLSTTTRYGLRALIELAKNREGEFISLKEISKRQKIPIRYLENIMLKLVGGGIVVSSRGKGGGFKLSRDPSEIKISDVIEFLEGPISLVPCLEDSSLCSRTAKCE